jgi:hypothetical protein
MKIKGSKQIGYKNRVYELLEDFNFNGYTLKKGLKSDGGSVPKTEVLIVLIYLTLYISNWWAILLYPIARTENNGWFQKAFYAHDQRWEDSKSWSNFIPSNYKFFKDILFKLTELKNSEDSTFTKFHDLTVGLVILVVYPLTVTISPSSWIIFSKKLKD